MDENKAIEFIKYIINGINPINGEKLKDKELFSNKEMREVFNMCIKGIEILNAQNNSCLQEDTSWSKEEDEQLIQEYCEGIDIEMLAMIHQRSEESVKDRLIKNGIEIEL